MFQAQVNQQQARFIIDPSNGYYRIWRIIVGLAVAYISLASPYIFGFVGRVTVLHRVVDAILSVVFLLDLVVSHMIKYVDRNNSIVSEWRMTARYYLLHQLGVWDAFVTLSVFPLLFFNNHYVMKASYMIKLGHVCKLFKLLAKLENNQYKGLKKCLNWGKPVFVTLFSIHVMGCIFFFTACCLGLSTTRGTWIDLAMTEKEPHSITYLYIKSIYWSTTSFTTVGYGDLHPVNMIEMMIGIVSMLINMLVYNYIMNLVTILMTPDQEPNNVDTISRELRDFVTRHPVSLQLRRDMYNFILKSRNQHLEFNINVFPEEIQLRLKQELMPAAIANSYLFNKVPVALAYQLIKEMKLVTFRAGETIISQDDVPKRVYILVKGALEVFGITLTNSNILVCGECGVVCNLSQPFTVNNQRAGPSTLISLSRSKLLKLLELNGGVGETILTNILENLQVQGEHVTGLIKQINKKIDRNELGFSLGVRFATRRPNTRLLRQLITLGDDLEDVYEAGRNILHIVANAENDGMESCLSVLLEHSPNSIIYQEDVFYSLPLDYAIRHGRDSILNVFRTNNVSLPKWKVLAYYQEGVRTVNLRLIGMVHNLGGDIDIVSEDGSTPLHLAVARRKPDVVQYLMSLNANPFIADENQKTVWDLASEDGDMLTLLNNYRYQR